MIKAFEVIKRQRLSSIKWIIPVFFVIILLTLTLWAKLIVDRRQLLFCVVGRWVP